MNKAPNSVQFGALNVSAVFYVLFREKPTKLTFLELFNTILKIQEVSDSPIFS